MWIRIPSAYLQYNLGIYPQKREEQQPVTGSEGGVERHDSHPNSRHRLFIILPSTIPTWACAIPQISCLSQLVTRAWGVSIPVTGRLRMLLISLTRNTIMLPLSQHRESENSTRCVGEVTFSPSEFYQMVSKLSLLPVHMATADSTKVILCWSVWAHTKINNPLGS